MVFSKRVGVVGKFQKHTCRAGWRPPPQTIITWFDYIWHYTSPTQTARKEFDTKNVQWFKGHPSIALACWEQVLHKLFAKSHFLPGRFRTLLAEAPLLAGRFRTLLAFGALFALAFGLATGSGASTSSYLYGLKTSPCMEFGSLFW